MATGIGFKPNSLSISNVDDLEDWQLLVAACHFGPTMGDCHELDFEYKMVNGEVFVVENDGYGDVTLSPEVDLSNPAETLERFTGLNWRVLARHVLHKAADDGLIKK